MFNLKKVARLEGEIDLLKKERLDTYAIKEENYRLKNTNTELENKNRELSTKAREQNEADLYLISAKIQKEILDGKKINELQKDRDIQLALQAQLAQQQQQQIRYSPLSALGNIFGQYGYRY